MHTVAGIDESFGAIVSDLISLAEHLQASINLIEGAIARETSPGDDGVGNVIVLDDVTPQYLKVGVALQACRTSLETALRLLFETNATAGRPSRLTAGR